MGGEGRAATEQGCPSCDDMDIFCTTESRSRLNHNVLQRKSRVEKDVRRTDRGVPFFSGSRNPNVSMLRRILLTYAIYNFDLSYCQASKLRHSATGPL